MQGVLQIKLYDNRSESKTYKSMMELNAGDDEDPFIYSFPSGVLHGYKCISGPALVLYVTSNTYDPNEEIRLDYDDFRSVGQSIGWISTNHPVYEGCHVKINK